MLLKQHLPLLILLHVMFCIDLISLSCLYNWAQLENPDKDRQKTNVINETSPKIV